MVKQYTHPYLLKIRSRLWQILPILIIAISQGVNGFQGMARAPTTKYRASSTPQQRSSLIIPKTLLLASFLSCPPPRFDEFSERLLGKWKGRYSPSLASSTVTSTSGLVEEVMRSCGGAVQGIREFSPIGDIVSSGSESSETTGQQPEIGLYLNRANDGFVFQDLGSYSLGPVLSFDETQKGSLFLSNHMIGKDRFLLWGEISASSNDDSDACRIDLSCNSIQGMKLHRQPFLTISEEEEQEKAEGTEEIMVISQDELESLNIEIHRKVRCRMPSIGQPWMLQRAKWEEVAIDRSANENTDEDSVAEIVTDGDSSSSVLRGWIVASSRATTNTASNIMFNEQLIDNELSVADGTVLHSGVIFNKDENAPSVHSIQRYYDGTDKLIGIIFLEGRYLANE